MTIIELLLEDKVTGKWVKSTYGMKYECPCPLCKGTDRFHVWTNQYEKENFWCRQCGKGGSIIQYLMYFRDMTYQEACSYSGYYPSRSLRGKTFSGSSSVNQRSLPSYKSPSTKWQEQAKDFLETSIKIIRMDIFINERKWLNVERGLNDETIQNHKLGWNPSDQFSEREIWDLPDKIKEDGSLTKLWIPQGLVIPCFHHGQIQRLRIRRPGNVEPRYYFLPGSATIPMIFGERDIYIIVESELDALLLHQEVGDLLGVIALGSVMIKPDQEIMNMLLKSKRILISLDTDTAGANVSWNWWLSHFPNAIRWPVIKGKDPNEARLNGLNLRAWVQAGIQYSPRMKPEIAVKPLIVNPGEVLDQNHETHLQLLTDSGTFMKNLQKFKSSNELAISVRELARSDNKEKFKFIFLSTPDHPVITLDLNDQDNLRAIKEILASPSTKVFYDAKADLIALHELGVEVSGAIFDTMLVDQILTAGLKNRDKDRALTQLINEYLGEEGHSEKTSTNPLELTVHETAYLIPLKEILAEKLRESNLIETANLEFSCIRSTVDMEINGFLLNTVKLERIRDDNILVREAQRAFLTEELGEINLDSHLQLKEALHIQGIRIENTKEETLAPLCTTYPIISELISYRKASKIISQIDTLLVHVNQDTRRIHPHYNQIGAPTGRFSCSQPNLQATLRGEIRTCFIAPQGYKLIIADYSQIELRIAAEISDDQTMIEAYKRGQDLHKLTASVLMEKPLEQVTKEERQAAKAVNFGLIYAMGAQGLKDYAQNTYRVGMTNDQASEFRRKFFDLYKGIAQWHHYNQRFYTKETRTLGGRRRIWDGEPKITELLNSPVQGTSADITKRALILLRKRITGMDVRIIGCVHDEIILEAAEEQVQVAGEILVRAMKEAGEFYLKEVPVEVEWSIAESWGKK